MRARMFSSCYVCFMLFLVASSCGRICAQGNFSVGSPSFNCSINLICLGSAHTVDTNDTFNGSLSLIYEEPQLAAQSYAIAYYYKPVRLLDPSTLQSASFNTSFTIDEVRPMTNDYIGDGMTFVISADNETLGGPAKLFGFFDAAGTTLFKSIVVEFDNYQNAGSPAYDISDNHVSLDIMNITAVVARNASDVGVDLWNNLTTYVWIEYSADKQLFEVRISNNTSRPITAFLNYTVDLFNVVDEYMWVGFSGGNGDSYSYYYIKNWTFESYGIPPKALTPAKAPVSMLGTIVGISVAVPALLVAVCVFIFFIRRLSYVEDPMLQLPDMPERFSYKKLSKATRAFSDKAKLGHGGFGNVYKGLLPSSGTPVAVKKIKSDSKQGEREFMAEVLIISQIRHRNLIRLLGWCKNRGKYLLVYELMPNGSLDQVLFGRSEKKISLLWTHRLNIVTGTAAAVAYIHKEWNQQVIHRDIKASNIMLDKEWNAKLGDFGLARLVDHQDTAHITQCAGTPGYIAPEALASSRITDKTDVFAFGAVLLEIACGREACSLKYPADEIVLVDWVWHRHSEGKLLSTVDSQLEDYDTNSMEVVLLVGLLCSHPNPMARPSMQKVVQMLSGDIPVPWVPASKPAAVFQSVLQNVNIEDLHAASPNKGTMPDISESGSISLT